MISPAREGAGRRKESGTGKSAPLFCGVVGVAFTPGRVGRCRAQGPQSFRGVFWPVRVPPSVALSCVPVLRSLPVSVSLFRFVPMSWRSRLPLQSFFSVSSVRFQRWCGGRTPCRSAGRPRFPPAIPSGVCNHLPLPARCCRSGIFLPLCRCV